MPITKELELVLVTWQVCRNTFHQYEAEDVDRALEDLVEVAIVGSPYPHPDDPLETIYPKPPKDYKKWHIDDPVRNLEVE